jgi:hypothetical protein
MYISFKPSDYAQAVSRMNDDLEQISKWCKSNCLALNPKKSKIMLIGTRKIVQKFTNIPLNITINGEPVERVESARNLRLVFDSHLNFESHIAECTRNCFFRLKLLYKIRNYLSQELRVVLCESLILSKLNYCDTVYGPCLLSRTAKLVQRVQNACTRYCFNVPQRSNVTPFLDAANMLKMEAQRQLHLALMLFGIIEGNRPLYLFKKLVWAKDFKRYPKRACT